MPRIDTKRIGYGIRTAFKEVNILGVLALLSLVSLFFTYYSFYYFYNLALSCLLFLLSNLFWSLTAKPKINLPFALFNISIFIFLLGRPIFLLLIYGDFPDLEYPDGIINAFDMIIVSLISLRLASQGLFKIRAEKDTLRLKEVKDFFSNKKRFSLVWVIFFMYLASWIQQLLDAVAIKLFIHAHSYHEYYVSYTSPLPGLLFVLKNISPYLFFGLLAFFPKRRITILAFFSQFIIAVIQLSYGSRGNAISLILVLFIYLVVYPKRKFNLRKLLKRRASKIALISGGIVVLLGLVLSLAYIGLARGTVSTNKISSNNLISRFIIDQGVTFNVVSNGSVVYDSLPNRGHAVYTFGLITDQVSRGWISETVFHLPPAPAKQTVEAATELNFLVMHIHI